MRGLVIAATLALSLMSFDAARPQSAVAVEAGFLTAFEDAVFLAGIRMTSVKPQSSVGVDFSLHTSDGSWLALTALTFGVAWMK